MHIGTETAITLQTILLLSWTSISSANLLTDIPKSNPLNIDWNPAPPPEKGPPLSAGASRDPSLLPIQIGGIVGAYLFSVCIVGIALILVGRKLRKAIKHSQLPDVEMVHTPFHKNFDNFNSSPVSPGALTPGGARNFSWPSPEKDTRNPYVFPATVHRSPTTPTVLGDPYVDTRIVEADREMLQRDLEDIYAHVMEQEEAKAAGVKLKEMPLPPQLQRVGPVPAGGPQRQDSPAKKSERFRPGNLNIDEAKPNPKKTSRASSIISSLKSPRLGLGRKSTKELRISSPMQTPMSATFPMSANSDEEPLSPRYYTPPPPPPVPKDQVPYTHSRNTSAVTPVSPTRSIAEQMHFGNPAPSRHHPNPSQTSVQTSHSMRGDRDRISSATTNSQTPLFITPPQPSRIKHIPAPLPTAPLPQQHSQQYSQQNAPTARALPFRSYEPPLASPSFNTVTKTTVLERHERNNGPMTGGLRTPWSAGAVPYSPYQPFSPMIPITPRLVTKEDRKAMKKFERRTPVVELVQKEDDIWDSGY